MNVSERAQKIFAKRCQDAVELIKSKPLDISSIGIFGSYARGTYYGTSDIDIMVIVNEFLTKRVKADLVCDCDEMGVDLHFIMKEDFEMIDTAFLKAVRKDFKEVYHAGE